MNKDSRTIVGVLSAVLILIVLAVAGWINNIITLLGMDSIDSGMAIARVVGIFLAPLGVVLGYI